MNETLRTFLAKQYHHRSDGITSLAAVHKAFCEVLTDDERRLYPKWKLRKDLEALGYVVGLGTSGAMSVAGISETQVPSYMLVNGVLTLVRP